MTQGKGETTSSYIYTSQIVIDTILSDLKWEEVVQYYQPFDTSCYAVSTIQKFQEIEKLQPALTWKPPEVIKHTLDTILENYQGHMPMIV